MKKERSACLACNGMMNKNYRKIILPVITAGVLIIGGTSAYLTDRDSVVNEFTVGKVSIDLQEPSWNPDDHTEMVPLDEMQKDPKIVNSGSNDAYVYLEVTIPVRDVITAAADGSRKESAATELFSYQINDQWKLLEQKKDDTSATYVYAYQKVLKPGETTQTLFDTVTFANVIEGQIDHTSFEIPVNAYAIQTNHTASADADIDTQVQEAYQKYIRQNSTGESSS